MQTETQILSAVLEYIYEKCRPFSRITTGGLSQNGGINAEIAPGFSKSDYLGGGALLRLPLLITIRHKSHKTAMETAFSLAEIVRKTTRCANEIHEAVANVNVGTAPEFVQRAGADYIYSLIINIDYLQK